MKLLRATSSAFSLVEVTLALGVAAFCLTTILGLLPLGLNSNQASIEQTVSSCIAKAVMADLRATPPGQSSTRFGFTVPAGGASTTASNAAVLSAPQTIFLHEDSSPTVGQTTGVSKADGQSHYRVTVAFYPNPTPGQLTATGVRILVTWPALADPSPSTPWPVNYSSSCEILTALNCN
jgi:type II secretory pathway pseudopilin PulG